MMITDSDYCSEDENYNVYSPRYHSITSSYSSSHEDPLFINLPSKSIAPRILPRGNLRHMPTFRRTLTKDCTSAERGFTFSPVGLLIPYMVGVAMALHDFDQLTPSTYIGGGSAGAITTILMGSNLSRQRAIDTMYKFFYKCHTGGTFRKLNAYLTDIVTEEFDEQSIKYLNERPAKVTVSYTVIDPVSMLPSEPRFVHQFKDVDDLRDVLRASCNIPFYLDNAYSQTVRGELAVDGFFGVNLESFGCPPTALESGVDVSIIPFDIQRLTQRTPLPPVKWNVLSNDVISPHLRGFFTLPSGKKRRRYLSKCQDHPNTNSISHYFAPMSEEDIALWTCYINHYFPTPNPSPTMTEVCSVLGVEDRTTPIDSSNGSDLKLSRTKSLVGKLMASTSTEVTRRATSQERQIKTLPRKLKLMRHEIKDSPLRQHSAGQPSDSGDAVANATNEDDFFDGSLSMTRNKLDVNSDLEYDPLPTMKYGVYKLASLIVRPSNSDRIKHMFDAGRADAFRWLIIERRAGRLNQSVFDLAKERFQNRAF